MLAPLAATMCTCTASLVLAQWSAIFVMLPWSFAAAGGASMASSGSGGKRPGPPPRPGKPTAAKSRPAKPPKTRMPAGVHMPAEGEPGTLTSMLRSNRKRRLPDSDGEESQPSSPQTPPAPPSPAPEPRSTAAVVAAADGAPSTAVLLRKFHSYAQYHCDDLYVSEAMRVYKSAKKD